MIRCSILFLWTKTSYIVPHESTDVRQLHTTRARLNMVFRTGTRLGVILLLTFIQCTNPQQGSGADFTGSLSISVVDSPATLQEFIVVFQRLEIHRSGTDSTFAWRVVTSNVNGMDLLQLRNGQSRPLMQNVPVPVGQYDAFRLYLSAASYLTINGNKVYFQNLTGVTNTFVLQYQLNVLENQSYNLVFDFDVSRSLRSVSSGYQITPYVRIQETSVAGTISGAVFFPTLPPSAAFATISTHAGTDLVETLTDTAGNNGSFQLPALPEGTYSLTIAPTDTTYRDTTITGLQVVRLRNTPIGTVTLRAR